MAPEISIILATYNGEQYLSEQLESILTQNCDNWQLIIRDDGSGDDTLNVVNEYVQQYPEKIRLLTDINQSVEASRNFSQLLGHTGTDYVMFCDQDDIWLPEKISKTLLLMKSQEQQYGPKTPLLVFTDTKVVDENLKVLSNSNLKYQNLDPKRISLNHLLLQNVPSGCTMMMNCSLVDLGKPIPLQAVMHDHWVSLVAAAFGKIVFLDEPTMLYRQHDNNYYGASCYGWGHFYRRYRQGIDAARKRLSQYVDQAATFYDRHAQSLQPQQRQMLAEFSQWPELSWLGRRKLLLKHRIFKTGFRRNIGLFLIV